jgi:hypothetical protein
MLWHEVSNDMFKLLPFHTLFHHAVNVLQAVPLRAAVVDAVA